MIFYDFRRGLNQPQCAGELASDFGDEAPSPATCFTGFEMLIKMETASYIIGIIRSYLSDRKLRYWSDGCSEEYSVWVVVPQGSVLGPNAYRYGPSYKDNWIRRPYKKYKFINLNLAYHKTEVALLSSRKAVEW